MNIFVKLYEKWKFKGDDFKKVVPHECENVHRDNNTKNYSHPVLRLDSSLKLWGEHNKKNVKNFVNKVMLSVRETITWDRVWREDGRWL